MQETGIVFTNLGDEIERDLTVNLPSELAHSTNRSSRPRVLVVDDERLIADTCTEILESAGFDVETAYDGHAALNVVAAFHPDYLLTDVLMPRMNGVELAIAITKAAPRAKILLFSGQAGISEILREGRDHGYNFELIAKPIHPTKLIERLQQLAE